VLIPRPETELLIDFVQEAVAAAPALGAGAWADLGTGSGALATGVARALPQARRVYAVDLSPAPLAYAAFNAQRLGVGSRLTALRGSWYEPLEAAGVRQLAGVVSNPPYIASTDMPGLQAEVGR
jgi:release factor glutamine methyltransferase